MRVRVRTNECRAKVPTVIYNLYINTYAYIYIYTAQPCWITLELCLRPLTLNFIKFLDTATMSSLN